MSYSSRTREIRTIASTCVAYVLTFFTIIKWTMIHEIETASHIVSNTEKTKWRRKFSEASDQVVAAVLVWSQSLRRSGFLSCAPPMLLTASDTDTNISSLLAFLFTCELYAEQVRRSISLPIWITIHGSHWFPAPLRSGLTHLSSLQKPRDFKILADLQFQV